MRCYSLNIGHFPPMVLALLLQLSLLACSGTDNAPDPTELLRQRDPLAVDCFACHDGVREAWLAGHGNGAINPDYAALGDRSGCLQCHDPYDLGRDPIAAFGDSRPMVSCRACHGGDEFHAGSSQIPDAALCGGCHDGNVPPDHTSFQRNRFQGIYERYTASAHARSSTFGDPACAACHTDKGFRLYGEDAKYDESGGQRALGRQDWLAEFAGLPELEDPGVITCHTCHDPHDGELRAQASFVDDDPAAGVLYSRTFNLCTSCHQVFLQRVGFEYRLDPEVYTPGDGESGDDLLKRLEFHADQLGLVIGDSHFAGEFPVVDNDVITMISVAGHGINAASDRACTQCHNPHRP